MANKNKAVFRIRFRHHDQLVELYAHGVSQSSMVTFVELSELIFNNKTDVVIDPSEEKIKAEFDGVKNTYIPVHAILRIDEVDKSGPSKIRPLRPEESGLSRVTPFPSHHKPDSH